MKSDYRIRAQKFLDNILPYISDVLTDTWVVGKIVEEYNVTHSRKIEIHEGSARCALVTSDYVIKWDYSAESVEEIGGCEKEWEVYQQAKREGMAYLLAECTLIEREGVVFEIMPRIPAIGRKSHKANDIAEMLTDEEYCWLSDIGLLRDMHSWNWGIKYNKPVIIDYAFLED